jgi:hypothetical protein
MANSSWHFKTRDYKLEFLLVKENTWVPGSIATIQHWLRRTLQRLELC